MAQFRSRSRNHFFSNAVQFITTVMGEAGLSAAFRCHVDDHTLPAPSQMDSEEGCGNAGLKDRISAHLDRHHFRVRGNIEKVLASRRAGFGRMAWSGATLSIMTNRSLTVAALLRTPEQSRDREGAVGPGQ